MPNGRTKSERAPSGPELTSRCRAGARPLGVTLGAHKETILKTLPTEVELKSCFNDFLEFSLDFLQHCEENRRLLKLSAVNSQIALELFLKYYFKRLGKEDEIRRRKGSKLINDYVEFSQMLGHFYSTRTWSYGEKKELVRLLKARNSIIHRAQDSDWDEELAVIIARVFFFIHATSWSEFGENILFNNYKPHAISKIPVWRKGAESFAEKIAELWHTSCQKCLSCEAYAVISGELMSLDESTTDEDMICLCCMTSINLEHEARLLECHNCFENAYWIDALNEQDKQLYVGKCMECDTRTWVRRCFNCEKFYHPSATDEVIDHDKYFCCLDCKIIYLEENT